MDKLIQRSFLNALGTGAYVALVAIFMKNGGKIFEQADNVTGPMAFLMLFVLSAAVTGGLVLGKPLLMYLNNEKKEAVRLFIYTLAWLAAGIVVLLLVNLK